MRNELRNVALEARIGVALEGWWGNDLAVRRFGLSGAEEELVALRSSDCTWITLFCILHIS